MFDIAEKITASITCILCGVDVESNANVIQHMTDEHKACQEINFILAGCLMKKDERDAISDIFWGHIKDLVTPKIEVVEEKVSQCSISEPNIEQNTIINEVSDIEQSNDNVEELCEVCNLTFPNKRSLIKHTNKFHKKVPNTNIDKLKGSSLKFKESVSEKFKHLKKIKSPEGENEEFCCVNCSLDFKKGWSFNKHKRTCRGDLINISEAILHR